jgi:hypothetical protein
LAKDIKVGAAIGAALIAGVAGGAAGFAACYIKRTELENTLNQTYPGWYKRYHVKESWEKFGIGGDVGCETYKEALVKAKVELKARYPDAHVDDPKHLYQDFKSCLTHIKEMDRKLSIFEGQHLDEPSQFDDLYNITMSMKGNQVFSGSKMLDEACFAKEEQLEQTLAEYTAGTQSSQKTELMLPMLSGALAGAMAVNRCLESLNIVLEELANYTGAFEPFTYGDLPSAEFIIDGQGMMIPLQECNRGEQIARLVLDFEKENGPYEFVTKSEDLVLEENQTSPETELVDSPHPEASDRPHLRMPTFINPIVVAYEQYVQDREDIVKKMQEYNKHLAVLEDLTMHRISRRECASENSHPLRNLISCRRWNEEYERILAKQDKTSS